MDRISKTENLQIDITNATDQELEQIKNEVLKNLVVKAAAKRVHPDLPVETHDRHSSIHSKG